MFSGKSCSNRSPLLIAFFCFVSTSCVLVGIRQDFAGPAAPESSGPIGAGGKSPELTNKRGETDGGADGPARPSYLRGY